MPNNPNHGGRPKTGIRIGMQPTEGVLEVDTLKATTELQDERPRLP